MQSKRAHSVSGCNEYDRCPRRYRYGYLDRAPHDRPTPAAWRHGIAVHAALETSYREQMNGRAPAETIPAALDALESAWRAEHLPDDDAWRERSGEMVTRTITDDPLNLGSILGVEQRFEARSAGGRPFAGIADLVVQRDDHTVEIIDHKVSRSPRSPAALAGDRQLNLYGWFAAQHWPWATRFLATHHYPPLGATVTVELDPARRESIAGELDAIAARADADVDYPPTPGPECSTCPWITRCPAHAATTG
ncbi:MAG: RecB family exonuclease [Actinomycetota bacterium]